MDNRNNNKNNTDRRRSDDEARHYQGDPNFTSLDIPPDYEDGGGSGEYDNSFGNNNNNGRRFSDNGRINTGFQEDDGGDNVDGRNARDAIELKSVTNLGSSTLRGGGYKGAFHRRAKSQHQNGYDYFYRQHKRERSVAYAEPQPDYPTNESPTEHNMNLEDIAATMQYLKNLKIRRRTSKKKLGSSKGRGGEDDDGVGSGLGESFPGDRGEAAIGDEDNDTQDGESYEEEIGLPSAREKTKGLADKMLLAKQLDSAAEVARQYEKRDSIWEVKHRTFSLSRRSARRKTNVATRAGKSFQDWYKAIWYKLSFWSPHFKEIEGQCGIATTTYFRFTRWLVKINLLVFLIFLSFLYVPQFITWAEPSKNIFIEEIPLNVSQDSKGLRESVTCSDVYGKYVENISDYTGIPVVLDIVKGTGILEDTFIFYGRYSNLSLTYKSTSGEYQVSTDFNMSLVYMLVMLASFLIIFIMIVRRSSLSVKETIMDYDNKAIASYSNSILAGWDYCINSEKMAFYKQRIIYNDFQAKLEQISIKKRQQMRTRDEIIKLYFKRFLINFVVLCILGGCFTAIVFTTNFLLEKQEEDLGEVESLLIEFLPSIVITVLNFFIPLIFMVLVEKEEYSPTLSTSLTIIRAVFLRISLVGVLLFSIYYRLFHKKGRDSYACPEEGLSDMTTTCCGNPLWRTTRTVSAGEQEKGSVKCWETYVGQQFYKLAVADFFNVCVAYFAACALRKFVHNKFENKLWIVKKVGLARFDLPLEVLDIVYTQTLCWVGMFFAPLMPTFCLFQTFVYFFNKKYLLLKLCEPPKNNYRASRNYSFFQVVLLVTFTVICVVLGYMIGNIQPSKSCGPFRVWATPEYVMFNAVTHEVDTWPAVPRGIFNLFGTVAFLVPAFLVLGMAIYYYWAVSLGFKRLEKLLRQQLKSESYDKQYLLARVTEAIVAGHLNLHTDGHHQHR